MREQLPHCSPPFGKSGLAVVNFLTATDQCDNDRPVRQTVHDTEHERRLGINGCQLVALVRSSAAQQFFSHFRRVPRALGLVKDNDVFGRELVGQPVGFQEGVDALNEGADAPSRFSQGLTRSAVVVQGEGFSDHFDQRPVARKKSTGGTPIPHELRAVNGLQACQRLPRSRNTRDETHELPTSALRPSDCLRQNVRGASQIDGFRMRMLDVAHTVVREEHLGGFHDVRNRRVCRAIPRSDVDLPAFRIGLPGVRQINQRVSERVVCDDPNCFHEVVRFCGGGWLRRARFRENGQGNYHLAPAFLVEVPQLDSVVLDLALGCCRTFRHAGLELQHKHKFPSQQDTINATIAAWDFVFQQHTPTSRCRHLRQHLQQSVPENSHSPLPGDHGREA